MKKLILLLLFSLVNFYLVNIQKSEGFQVEDPTESKQITQSEYLEVNELLEKKKWEEAAHYLQNLLKKQPESIPAKILLTKAWTYTGRREEALNLLIQAVEHQREAKRSLLIKKIRVLSRLFLKNSSFQIYQDGLNLMIAKKFRAAKERFEKALSEEPSNCEILIRLGETLILDNNDVAAVQFLNLAKKLNPFDPEIRLLRGKALYYQKGTLEALPELRHAHSKLKGFELASVWLAEALFFSGQPMTAIRLLENDVKEFPFHVLSLIHSAKMKLQYGRSDLSLWWSARKDLQLAMSRLPEYLAPHNPLQESGLIVGFQKSENELKSEIQKLIQQVDSKLNSS